MTRPLSAVMLREMKQPIESASEQQGRWVPSKTYAGFYNISAQTLTNWRYADRKAGRTSAAPGFPVYRYFGRCVRYYLETASGAPNLAA